MAKPSACTRSEGRTAVAGPRGVHVTTGGGLSMTVEQRLAAPLVAKPEMCSLNMGSMNFGIFPLADRYKTWEDDWEEP
jgi:3,5-dioxohexanoate:acetyl-CoA acetone transferase